MEEIMADFNKVILAGHLTKIPDVRTLQNNIICNKPYWESLSCSVGSESGEWMAMNQSMSMSERNHHVLRFGGLPMETVFRASSFRAL